MTRKEIRKLKHRVKSSGLLLSAPNSAPWNNKFRLFNILFQ
nr:MAG TPA: hypothetical protein [Caudoviricetes sp.]